MEKQLGCLLNTFYLTSRNNQIHAKLSGSTHLSGPRNYFIIYILMPGITTKLTVQFPQLKKAPLMGHLLRCASGPRGRLFDTPVFRYSKPVLACQYIPIRQ